MAVIIKSGRGRQEGQEFGVLRRESEVSPGCMRLCQNKTGKKVLRLGMATFQMVPVCFPAPTWWLQTSIPPIPGGSNMVFWPLGSPSMHMVHRHTRRPNSLTHKTKTNKSLKKTNKQNSKNSQVLLIILHPKAAPLGCGRPTLRYILLRACL